MSKERDDSSAKQEYDFEVNGEEKSSKHSGRDKDRKRSTRGEEKEREHRSKDSKEHGKDRSSRDSKVKDKDYEREKSREKDRKDRGKEKEREKGRDRDRDRDREKDRERLKEKDREKHKERDNEKDREREREKGRERNKDGEAEEDKERLGERGKVGKRGHDEDYQMDHEDSGDRDRDVLKQGKVSFHDEDEQSSKGKSGGGHVPSSELEERILKMKEERSKKKSDAGSEVLDFVNRMRKIEAKRNSEKEKAMQLSKVFEEQDNMVQEESDDEEGGQHTADDLAGLKILDGLENVMEGGAVVLTLKDQSILAGGGINEEVDMLENVEIGEQKRRDDAYKAAKKKTGIYDDKFNDDPSSEKRILPQYDDKAADEGVTLDAQGRFTGEAEKKLEELRRRLQGASTNNRFEDLNSSGKIASDYYTQEEMLQFKKPKKKKAMRKKLDIDAMEAEAVAAGLGKEDLGSRNDGRNRATRKEQDRAEAEMRQNAYQSAYAKADEASRALRLEQTLPVKEGDENLPLKEEDENQVFAADDEDLYKSLERARKLALKKQEVELTGPEAIARRAISAATNQNTDNQDPATGESQEKLVVTEMEEFVWGLQHDEEVRKPETEDVFMDEDEAPGASDQEMQDEAGGWTEVNDASKDEDPVNEDKEDLVPDETIHEVPVGKGLSGALKLLKERGTLKETVEWGGRNMDKKKSKLVGIMDDDADNKDKFKDIRIERTDEFGRIMTPKEAFRMISHKFHGKGPGKMKLEKRMKQYQEELKLKQMKNSDTPSLSVERMREAQAQLKTPYLVLSGHVKPGQTSDPRSGFATVEKDFPGSLTPMLGDRKVEHFLGIKRKADSGDNSTPKKPKH